jgi:hypothetical protein
VNEGERIRISVVRDSVHLYTATISGDNPRGGHLIPFSVSGSTPDDALGRLWRLAAWAFEAHGIDLEIEKDLYKHHCSSCGGTGRRA